MTKADRRARKRENRLQGQAQRAAEAKRRKQRSGLIRGLIIAAVVVAALVLIIATGHKSKKSATTTSVASTASCTHTKPARGSTKTYTKAPAMTIDTAKTYTATMTTSCGTITIVLDPKDAPKTVNSFVFLARAHFYDGLAFHRVVPDFVVQGGDPKGDGTGGPGYELATEAPKNGYKAGSVAMANTGQPNSTGSQFFLTVSANGAQTLMQGGAPYKYSILGQMDAKGLAVVRKMETFARSAPLADGSQPPTQPLYIDKVTISES